MSIFCSFITGPLELVASGHKVNDLLSVIFWQLNASPVADPYQVYLVAPLKGEKLNALAWWMTSATWCNTIEGEWTLQEQNVSLNMTMSVTYNITRITLRGQIAAVFYPVAITICSSDKHSQLNSKSVCISHAIWTSRARIGAGQGRGPWVWLTLDKSAIWSLHGQNFILAH